MRLRSTREKLNLAKQHEAALDRQKKHFQEAHSLEIQELVLQHQQTVAEAKDMTARRDCDQKQFIFTVRGHDTLELSGSVPCQIFALEPNSMLNKMYNSEWAYAKDEKGRACINSDPAPWPLIMQWLSYGAVPSLTLCSSAFIAECEYWQLDNLLAAVEELRTAEQEQQLLSISNADTAEHSIKLIQITQDGRKGFQMEGQIHDFVQRFASTQAVDLPFAADGAVWNFQVAEDGVWLFLQAGPQLKRPAHSIRFGEGSDLWRLVWSVTADSDFKAGCSGKGRGWPKDDKAVKVQHCPFANLQGPLLVTVRVLLTQRP